jgi:hypothetical protein
MSKTGIHCAPYLYQALVFGAKSQAIPFFFQNYVLVPAPQSRGYLEHLVLTSSVDNSMGLEDAMTAIGLAGLAVRRKDPSLLLEARAKHRLAISRAFVAFESLPALQSELAPTTMILLSMFNVC